VGEPGYYEQLQALIDGLEAGGAGVHCEGASVGRCGIPAEVSAEEQTVLDELARCRELTSTRVGQVFGWVHQHCALPIAATWRVTDLHYVEVMRLTGTAALLHQTRRANRVMDWPEEDPMAPHRLRLSVAVSMRAQASNNRLLRRAFARRTDRILVGHRNQIALECLDQEPADRDVVMLWGAGHLPGLGAGLATRGLVPTENTWYRVGHLPGIRATLRAARTSAAETPREPAPR